MNIDERLYLNLQQRICSKLSIYFILFIRASIMDNCTANYIHVFDNASKDQTCKYVTQYCQQQTVQFIQTYYCGLDQSILLLIIISAVVLVLIYYGLNILTNHYLTQSVEHFIKKLNMSQALAGVTFLAFANGAPDIMTTIVAGSSSSQTTALIPLGSLYGAALFNMAFILSTVIKFSPNKELTINKKEALIPLSFYILGTIYLLTVSVAYGKMNLIISIVFLSLYLVFIAAVFYEEHLKVIKKRKEIDESASSTNQNQLSSLSHQLSITQTSKAIEQQKKVSLINKIEGFIQIFYRFIFDYTIPPTNEEQWAPIKSAISLILSPIIIFLSFGVSSSFEISILSMPFAFWFSFPSLFLLTHTLYCAATKTIPNKLMVIYSVYSFIINICFITMFCSILINLVELIQIITNINSVFLGLTVFSWANSIGDYLSILAFAKKGNTSTAVASIFSGPLLTFLLGFGVTCTLNSFQGEYEFIIFDFKGDQYDKISDTIILCVMAMATVYMVWTFIQILRKKGVLKRFQQKFTFFFYVGLLAIGLILTIIAHFYKQN